jgi:hypothetical protein
MPLFTSPQREFLSLPPFYCLNSLHSLTPSPSFSSEVGCWRISTRPAHLSYLPISSLLQPQPQELPSLSSTSLCRLYIQQQPSKLLWRSQRLTTFEKSFFARTEAASLHLHVSLAPPFPPCLSLFVTNDLSHRNSRTFSTRCLSGTS